METIKKKEKKIHVPSKVRGQDQVQLRAAQGKHKIVCMSLDMQSTNETNSKQTLPSSDLQNQKQMAWILGSRAWFRFEVQKCEAF
jgi:CRISPR/Cas system type I-B associated protein Csh2 (Cas7 group RAMP superfamily)